jgi:hypothetical protein
LEGVVSKRRLAPYRSGECRDWRKVKTVTSREANRECWHQPSAAETQAGMALASFLAWHRGLFRHKSSGVHETGSTSVWLWELDHVRIWLHLELSF